MWTLTISCNGRTHIHNAPLWECRDELREFIRTHHTSIGWHYGTGMRYTLTRD